MIARKGFRRAAVWPQVRAAGTYHAAASERLADNETKGRYCSVGSIVVALQRNGHIGVARYLKAFLRP